jgi:folylpolyglutamate synthase/dihydropteroate synthase
MLHALAPAAARILTVTADSPRAMPAPELAARVREILPSTPCEPYQDIESAVASAGGEGMRAVCAGSIFLVGPLRARLLARGAVTVRYPAKATQYYLD